MAIREVIKAVSQTEGEQTPLDFWSLKASQLPRMDPQACRVI